MSIFSVVLDGQKKYISGRSRVCVCGEHGHSDLMIEKPNRFAALVLT